MRHKAVDAIGDLALAGAPLIGAYRSVRGGHKLNHAVLTALMADRGAWTYVEMPQPVRRERGHADLAAGLAAPAYGPTSLDLLAFFALMRPIVGHTCNPHWAAEHPPTTRRSRGMGGTHRRQERK